MNQRVKTIFEQAQTLSRADREELAELLLATVESGPELERAWADEASRRWEEHRSSGESAIDALGAIDDARTKLGR